MVKINENLMVVSCAKTESRTCAACFSFQRGRIPADRISKVANYDRGNLQYNTDSKNANELARRFALRWPFSPAGHASIFSRLAVLASKTGKNPIVSNDIDLKQYIRDIPDFPKPGILFRDITPLLASPDALREAVRRLADPFRDRQIDAIVAAEARGFIFAAPLALELNVGFVPIRKPGKLPFDTHSFHYELEYGTDTLEMHVDGVGRGDKVLVVDDLLATGGTVSACIELLQEVGAEVVACAFLIELAALEGGKRLAPHETVSLITY